MSRKPRISPSGPLDGESIPPGNAVGDVPTWDGTEYQPEQPAAGSLGAHAVIVQATSANNIFQVDSDQGDYVAPTGADFDDVVTGTGWTLTAAGCILTYGGALTNRALISLDIGCQGDVIGDSSNMGISVDGDLLGVTPAFQDSTMFWSPIDGVNTIHTKRIVTLAPGMTIQPVCGSATGVQYAISKLILGVTLL